MIGSSPEPGRWLREPLVHFLAIGALLFLAAQWSGAGASGAGRIVITPGQVDALVAGFTRTWQRPPTDQELKTQVDEYVREEIATREAMALGLDRDDTVIRRRLRQKLEFLGEDTLEAAPPTDAVLQAWLDAHPEAFRIEPAVAFHQVCDSQMLPAEVGLTTRSEVATIFGEKFADAILEIEPGRWVGPIQSTYGSHRVLVRERADGRLPALPEVRQAVEREFTADRRRQQLDAMYARLLNRYRIVVEKRDEAAK